MLVNHINVVVDVAPLDIVNIHLKYLNIMVGVYYRVVGFFLEVSKVFPSTCRDPHLCGGVELYIVSLYIIP